MIENIKEDDIILCTVEKIEGTTVFVNLEDNKKGTIVLSEIAAGRIRKIRQYVFPGKKIACKVLKIHSNHIELSLRRVTAKEREEALEEHQKIKTLENMLASLKIPASEIVNKIKSAYLVSEFLEEARENPKIIEQFLSKDESLKLSKILSERKEKLKSVKKIFTLKSFSPSGLSDIKSILTTDKAEIHYLGSSKFSISKTSNNLKDAEKSLLYLLEEIEKRAKQKHALFQFKEK